MAIHPTQRDDLRHAQDVALAVKDRGSDEFHVGLIFRDERRNFRLLHLADQRDLRNGAPSIDYLWVDIQGMDGFTAQRAATACRAVWELYEKEGLPYSVAEAPEFQDDFSLSNEGPGVGFTCTTFVMRVLEQRGIILLDEDTWRARPGDQAWRDKVIRYIREQHHDERHAEMMQQKQGPFRFQPLDIVAAALGSTIATFDEIEERLPEVRRRIMENQETEGTDE